MSEPYKHGFCDDGEDPYAYCEVSIFRARGDEWFVLEYWDQGIGFVVSKAMPSLYACDSGPQTPDHPDACEHGVRLKNYCPRCAPSQPHPDSETA